MSDKYSIPESFGNTFLGVVIAVCIAAFVFHGDPDIHDIAKAWLAKKSGTEIQKVDGE